MSTVNETKPRPERIYAIDALRGFDMFWITGGQMIVLYVAGLLLPVGALAFLEWQLEHVGWGEPLVAWDMIMPLFLFITGAAMPFSLERRIEGGTPSVIIYKKILRRVLILWLLGIIAQGNLPECLYLFVTTFSLSAFDDLHLYSNTLQAIASGYLITALLLMHTNIKGQIAAFFALLIGYWLLLRYVPVPGHEAGLLNPDLNLALYVDEQLLGRFRDGTNYTWILSSMGFGCTVLLGSFAGHLLKSSRDQKTKLLALIGLGIASLTAAYTLAIWQPMIKYIWTSSMLLWAGGWSYLLLALFYWLVDIREWRKWAFPFNVIGSNAIVAYMIGEVLGPIVWVLCNVLWRMKIFVRI